MAGESLNTALRTIDVARRVECSVQHVRNLESAGAMPPAQRTTSGYRRYSQVHVRCASAHRYLAVAIGPSAAKALLRAALSDPPEGALALLDAAHAVLHVQRRDLRLAWEAVAAISTESDASARPSDAMTISELAGALDVRPSTLRHWQAEHLLAPERDRHGARSYAPVAVREARIVHQLRLAGYTIPRLRTLVMDLRSPGHLAELNHALDERQHTLTTRSRALLEASTTMAAIIDDETA